MNDNAPQFLYAADLPPASTNGLPGSLGSQERDGVTLAQAKAASVDYAEKDSRMALMLEIARLTGWPAFYGHDLYSIDREYLESTWRGPVLWAVRRHGTHLWPAVPKSESDCKMLQRSMEEVHLCHAHRELAWYYISRPFAVAVTYQQAVQILEESMEVCKHDLEVGSRVVLPEFHNGMEVVPAQRVTVTEIARDSAGSGGWFVASVDELDRGHHDLDGVVEVYLSDLPAILRRW